MAFEDRCSPSQANSPGPVTGRVPPPHSENPAFSPSNQYTCTTIDSRYGRPNIAIVKVQPNSPPPSPEYQSYYRPETPDVKPSISQDFTPPLTFSISNILHPEFGLSAIRKTSKIEGPKPVGPNHSILYKPYDLSKQPDFSSKYSFEYLKSKEKEVSTLPPLGGLRQTVSQIGETKEDRPKIQEVQKRPDSANSMVSSASSGAVSCGSADANSQNSQGNASLWPAWVYCTRYSDRPSSGEFVFYVASNEKNLETFLIEP